VRDLALAKEGDVDGHGAAAVRGDEPGDHVAAELPRRGGLFEPLLRNALNPMAGDDFLLLATAELWPYHGNMGPRLEATFEAAAINTWRYKKGNCQIIYNTLSSYVNLPFCISFGL
jgi:hypothetical protein